MTEVATAEALIDAAESLFARDGIEGASLRAVMRDASADPGAVHYHFGNREQLAAAVLDRVLVPLNARRLQLLTEAENQCEGPIPLVLLLEALIRPDIESGVMLRGRGAGRPRLIGAMYISPALFVAERVEDQFRPVANRFMPHFAAALPHLPGELISWRIRWCVFGLLGALMSDDGDALAIGADELIARIVSSTAAAVAAPISTEVVPMMEVTASIDIDRPASEVFEYLADMANNPEWQQGQQRCTWTSEPPLRKGSTYDQEAKFLGKKIVSSFEVVEFDPGHRIRIRTTGGTMPIDVTREVAALSEDRSTVSAIVRGDPPMVFRLAGPLLTMMVRSSVRKDYQRLKALLES